MSAAAPGSRGPDRSIRVFVSSTFLDMRGEREELVKVIFPQLRKLCESRGVTWGEVDLRWGITDEQKAEGKVLPICLAEIHNCRPYFLGILGERYGWVPEELPAEALEREPWLSEHLERSITELEILHGVLNNPTMAKHAFFYFRDSAYVDSLPAAERPKFREQPLRGEIEQFGAEEAHRRAEGRRAKLEALKETILRSRFPVHEGCENPKALGRLVLADLTAVIDREYPAGSEPDPLDREAAEHEAFARKVSRFFAGRRDELARLDEHARGAGPPLVILGEPGIGKSAVLAQWALGPRPLGRDTVLLHFVGATGRSSDWVAMLSRLLAELTRTYGAAPEELPSSAHELRTAFANALHMAASLVGQALGGRLVLVLDGLDQLEDRDQAPDLVWLPSEIPDNVRLVVSTQRGRPLQELARRGWPTLELGPLELPEREQILVDYLAQYRKTLARAEVERITLAPQAGNPLYLRTLLEELRVWGEHKTLGDRIAFYVEADSLDELLEKTLERYEKDYEDDRSRLVREAFSLLWAARRGLSERELLELLGTDRVPLPAAFWSPLHLAAEAMVIDRSGLIGFAHECVRRAVEDRYLDDGGNRRAAHLDVANYFSRQDLSTRKVDELAWQLSRAGEWEALADQLSDLDFLEAACQADHFEVERYWAEIETKSSRRLVEAYASVVEAPQAHLPHLWNLAALFRDTGHLDTSLELRRHLVEHYRGTGESADLAKALGMLANLLMIRGEPEAAISLYREQERLADEVGDLRQLAGALGGQAMILTARGEGDEAESLHEREERIWRRLDDPRGLCKSQGNQGNLFFYRGDFDRAIDLYREQERLAGELGDQEELANSLGNQANIHFARGALDDALECGKAAEESFRRLGNTAGLQASLGKRGSVLLNRGDLDGAQALFEEQEQLCRETGEREWLARSLSDQALVLKLRGDLDRALALSEEAVELCRQVGNADALARCLGTQANLRLEADELEEALALHREVETICRDAGNPDVLAQSLGAQAVIQRILENVETALELHREEERLCRQLDIVDGLAISLANQALLLEGQGRLREAVPRLAEAIKLVQGHGLVRVASRIQPIVDTIAARLV